MTYGDLFYQKKIFVVLFVMVHPRFVQCPDEQMYILGYVDTK